MKKETFKNTHSLYLKCNILLILLYYFNLFLSQWSFIIFIFNCAILWIKKKKTKDGTFTRKTLLILRLLSPLTKKKKSNLCFYYSVHPFFGIWRNRINQNVTAKSRDITTEKNIYKNWFALTSFHTFYRFSVMFLTCPHRMKFSQFLLLLLCSFSKEH